MSLELSDGSVYEKKGKVDVLSGIVDKTIGTVSVRAVFDNSSRRIMSGSQANVVVPYECKDCVVIPQGATYELQDKVFAYRVINGRAVSTPIEVFEINDGKEYIVKSGLRKGDVIVSEGAGLLKDGTVVASSGTKKEK